MGEYQMRAREWIVAYCFFSPKDYDIPELPDWVVRTERCGRISFSRNEDDEPFITADRPMKVRR